MEWITSNWEQIALAITGTISVASIIVKFTPTQKDDEFLGKIVKLLSVIAFNKK
jgi:hypothetical protein